MTSQPDIREEPAKNFTTEALTKRPYMYSLNAEASMIIDNKADFGSYLQRIESRTSGCSAYNESKQQTHLSSSNISMIGLQFMHRQIGSRSLLSGPFSTSDL